MKLIKKQKSFRTAWEERRTIFTAEMDGSGSISGRGKGPIAEAKELDMFNAREEYDDLKLINNVSVKKLNQQIQEQDSLWSLSKKEAIILPLFLIGSC